MLTKQRHPSSNNNYDITTNNDSMDELTTNNPRHNDNSTLGEETTMMNESEEYLKFLHKPQVYACGLNTASQLDCASPESLPSFKKMTKIACGQTHCLAVSNSGELWSWGSGMGWKLGHCGTRDAITAQRVIYCERGSINNNNNSSNSNNNNSPSCTMHSPHSPYSPYSAQYQQYKSTTPGSDQDEYRMDDHHGDVHSLSSTSGVKRRGTLGSPTADNLLNRSVYTVIVNQKNDQSKPHQQQQQLSNNRIHQKSQNSSEDDDDGDRLATLHDETIKSALLTPLVINKYGAEQESSSVIIDEDDEHKFEEKNSARGPSLQSTEHRPHSNITITLNSFLPKIRDVACGEHHSVCVDVDGVVYTWGLGREGQLGTLSNTHHLPIPRAIDPVYFNHERVIKVSANSCFSMAVTESGSLYSWGWGGMYRLGHGDERTCNVPTRIEALNGITVKSVSCGWRHTCCITSNGHVYSWGDNSMGQLGLGNFVTRKLPVLIPQFVKTPAQQVACGAFFTLVLTRDNIVYGFGDHSSGALAEHLFGAGCQPVPRVLESVMLQAKLVSHISAGSEHACAVSVTGSVFCWGCNEYSQLGNESLVGDDIVCIPNLVTSTDKFQKAYCGGTFTMFMTEPVPSVQISEPTLVKNFQSLMNTEGSSDVSLRAIDGAVLAHRAILSARSPVLKRLISDQVSKSTQVHPAHQYSNQEEQKSLVEVDLTQLGIGHFELKAIVEYIYTGSMHFNKFVMGTNLANELLPDRVRAFSLKLGLDSLASVCDQLNANPNYSNFKIIDVHTLQNDMANFLNDSTSDFTIYIHRCDPYSDTMTDEHDEDTVATYKAHQSILVSRSEHFRTLIHANMMETQNKELHLYDIRCPEHFLMVLQFIYSDREDLVMEYLDREESDVFSENRRDMRVFEVLAIADSFLLTRLKHICEVFIEKNFGAPTEQLKDFAAQFQAHQLYSYCEFYLRRNKVQLDEQWTELETPKTTPLRLATRRMTIPDMTSSVLDLSMNEEEESNDMITDEPGQEGEEENDESNSAMSPDDHIEDEDISINEAAPSSIDDLIEVGSVNDMSTMDSESSRYSLSWSALTKRKKRMLGQRWRNWMGQYSEKRFKDKVKSLRRRQTWNKVSGFVWRYVKKVVLAAFLIVFYIPFLLLTFVYGWLLRSQSFDFDTPPPENNN